jgi:hypothetical protein
MRLNHFVLASALLLAPIGYCQSGEGTITGTVVNEQGDPVSGATIWCSVMQGTQSNSVSSGKTDATGKFQLEHLPWDTYTISATKHADGYGGSSQPVSDPVTLTSEHPAATVVLKLGPKEGILLPTVSDKVTGERLFDFTVHSTVEEFEGQTHNTSSGSWGVSRWTKQVLLPSNKDVMLHITKLGYRTWWYMDPSQPNGPGILRLQPGEVRELDIELEPAPKAAPQ